MKPTTPKLKKLKIPSSLSVAFFIGKLVGCVPFHKPIPSEKRCPRLLSILYLILTTSAELTVFTYYVLITIPFNFRPSIQISEGIVVSTTIVVVVSFETAKRLYYNARYKMVYELVERVRALETLVKGRGFCSSGGKWAVITFVWWAFWALIAASVVLQALHIGGPKSKWSPTAVVQITVGIWKASIVFSTVLLIRLGQKLLLCYGGVATEITATIGGGGWSQEGTATALRETQGCFVLYNKMAGFIALVSVLESSVLCILSPYIGVYYWMEENRFWVCEMVLLGVMQDRKSVV